MFLLCKADRTTGLSIGSFKKGYLEEKSNFSFRGDLDVQ
jgi:hypothetical protein